MKDLLREKNKKRRKPYKVKPLHPKDLSTAHLVLIPLLLKLGSIMFCITIAFHLNKETSD